MLREEARRLLGEDVTLELARDVLEKLVCPTCRREEQVFASLGKVTADKANCPHCPGTRREVVTFYKVRGEESFLDRTLEQLGIPPFDIILARGRERTLGLEIASDAAEVLGPLVGGQEELEWT
jgi:hypothetical protein